MPLHQGQPVIAIGEPLDQARAAMIMLHGRGGTADDILSLVDLLEPTGFAFLAPEAAIHTWYPNRFMEPIENNEPWLSSALELVGNVLAQIEQAGISAGRTILLGFSQGACLALEFAARNARRYGGVAGLTGGLIGPDDAPRNYAGSLAGMPVFLGCSDVDFHIPKTRVEVTEQVLRKLGADVTLRLYPNMGHTINQDELEFVRGMMRRLTENS